MYPTILFDLDGTLTDSGLGITKAVSYALRRWDIIEEDRARLDRFVGPPLDASFREFYGFSEEDSKKAVWVFREYYNDIGVYENEVYPGVRELLHSLRESGRTLAVATSKPEYLALRVLEHFGLRDYFDQVTGATPDEKRILKADVIRCALEGMGVTDKRDVVMVGDRKHDVEGARANGLDSIGILYGYGSREELEEAGATYIAPTAADILRCVEQ